MPVEQHVEHADVLGALDERRLQRRPHELALVDADLFDGADAVDRLGARRVDAGGAEVASEHDDRLEQGF